MAKGKSIATSLNSYKDYLKSIKEYYNRIADDTYADYIELDNYLIQNEGNYDYMTPDEKESYDKIKEECFRLYDLWLALGSSVGNHALTLWEERCQNLY